jgi:hypothetical protein
VGWGGVGWGGVGWGGVGNKKSMQINMIKWSTGLYYLTLRN